MELYSLTKIKRLIKEVNENPLRFWWEIRNEISWFTNPNKVIEGTPPKIKWYVGGVTNISYNAIDKNLDNRNKTAFYYINEKNEIREITYLDLFYEVNSVAHLLRELGVKKGDTISLLMPNIPEAIYFSLAAYRIGAILAIHYIGMSEEAFANRINDCNSKILITVSKTIRNGKEIRIKDYVDNVLEKYSTQTRKVIVVSRGYSDFNLVSNRDLVYEDIKPKGKIYVEPVGMDPNEPLIISYTSGTTGKPKGIYSTTAYIIASTWALKSIFGFREWQDTLWIISELG